MTGHHRWLLENTRLPAAPPAHEINTAFCRVRSAGRTDQGHERVRETSRGLPPARPTEAGTLPSAGCLESLEREDVIARWPFLTPIVESPGPPWRFLVSPGGMLVCMRAHDSYADALWVISESRIGLSRTPIRGRLGPAASTVDFAGSSAEVLAVLRQPPRWEGKA